MCSEETDVLIESLGSSSQFHKRNKVKLAKKRRLRTQNPHVRFLRGNTLMELIIRKEDRHEIKSMSPIFDVHRTKGPSNEALDWTTRWDCTWFTKFPLPIPTQSTRRHRKFRREVISPRAPGLSPKLQFQVQS